MPDSPFRTLALTTLAPAATRALAALDAAVHALGVEPTLLELVRVRASQLNGCAYCIDMHVQDARAAGEGDQRLHALTAWRETPFFNETERAALAWAEALTALPEGHGELVTRRDVLRAHVDERTAAALTFAIIAINAWNRVAITEPRVPGSYVRRSA